MIYYCTRIAKIRDYEIEKGDLGYIADKDLPEQECKLALLLEDVVSWEDYWDLPEQPYFKDTRKKVRIYSERGPTTIILESFDVFSKVMEDFYKRQINVIKN